MFNDIFLIIIRSLILDSKNLINIHLIKIYNWYKKIFNIWKEIPLTKIKDPVNHDDTDKENFHKWLVGFVDAEGCFKINYRGDNRFTFNITIHLHKDDRFILYHIKKFYNINANVYLDEKGCSLSIGNKNLLTNIFIPIFNKYPLLTKKRIMIIIYD